MKDVDKYLEESIENIRQDRDVTSSLLKDVMMYLSGDETRHEKVGQVAAKYVETLQRSNEQLVKIAGLMSKNEKNDGLSEGDMEDIYSMIKKEDD